MVLQDLLKQSQFRFFESDRPNEVRFYEPGSQNIVSGLRTIQGVTPQQLRGMGVNVERNIQSVDDFRAAGVSNPFTSKMNLQGLDAFENYLNKNYSPVDQSIVPVNIQKSTDSNTFSTSSPAQILTLPNGQRISPSDPNYAEYVKQYGQSSGGASSGASGSGSPAPSTSGGLPDVDMTGWSEAMKQSYQAMQDYVALLDRQGKTVNPNIEIDPAMVAKFVAQAKTELGPFFNQQFAQVEQDIGINFDRIAEDYELSKKQIGQQYGQALEGTQESFARRGLAFSSDRTKAEKDLAEQTSDTLARATQQTQRAAQDVGMQAERTLGSSKMPATRQFAFGEAPIVGRPGQYGLSSASGSRSFFTPTGNTTGTLERERLFEEERRAKELESNERQLRGFFTA